MKLINTDILFEDFLQDDQSITGQVFNYTGKDLQAIRNKIAGKSGIYYIFKAESGYVGQARDLYERLMAHLRKYNKEYSFRDSPALHAAMRKHLAEFKFYIIEFCPEAALDERERYWISSAGKNTFVGNNRAGYNLTPGGQDAYKLARHTEVVQYEYLPKSADYCDLTHPLATYISIVAAGKALFEDEYTDSQRSGISGVVNKKPIRNKKKDENGNIIYVNSYDENGNVIVEKSKYGYH